jgi:hypothetical protein
MHYECQEREQNKLLFIRLHRKGNNANCNSLKHKRRRDLDNWRATKAHAGYEAFIEFSMHEIEITLKEMT